MDLKKLTVDDMNEMKQFFRNVFTNPPWNEDWSNDEQLSAYINDLAGCFNSVCFGYYDADKMVGLCLGNKRHWWGGTEYVIEEFCILTELQGRGIGTSFLHDIEDTIKSYGMEQIYLCTDRDKPAYRFYSKRGFQELTDHVSFFKQL